MNNDTYSPANIVQWKKRFANAADEVEVVALAREFLSSIPEGHREMLGPEPVFDGHEGHDAVAEFALSLTQKEMSLAWDDVVAANTIRTIASVFIEASKRLNGLAEARTLRRSDFSGGRGAGG